VHCTKPADTFLYSSIVDKPASKTENKKRLPHLLLRQPLRRLNEDFVLRFALVPANNYFTALPCIFDIAGAGQQIEEIVYRFIPVHGAGKADIGQA